jgi:hypothetical protein
MRVSGILDACLLNASDMLLIKVVETLLMCIFLNSVHRDMRNSRVAIEDAGDLLEGRSLGLRVDEVHPDKLDSDPALHHD